MYQESFNNDETNLNIVIEAIRKYMHDHNLDPVTVFGRKGIWLSYQDLEEKLTSIDMK